MIGQMEFFFGGGGVKCVVPENILTHPVDGHWKSEGWGISKANFFKGNYEAQPEFPKGWGEGGGFKLKNHLWRG